jgi:hypothetical protein
VRRIEKETGAPMRYLIAPAPGIRSTLSNGMTRFPMCLCSSGRRASLVAGVALFLLSLPRGKLGGAHYGTWDRMTV